MKNKLRLVLLCVLFSILVIRPVSAQEPDDGVTLVPVPLPQDLTTEKERAEIEAEVAENIARFTAQGMLPAFASELYVR